MEQSQFPTLERHEAAEYVSRCVIAIETPEAMGTGFVISMVRPTEKQPSIHGITIGTAWHVLSDFHGKKGKKSDLKLIRWEDKIDLVSQCENVGLLPVMDEIYDCGVIICQSRQPLFELQNLLPFIPNDVMLRRGAEVSWLGFPGLVVDRELCFFNGHISGYVSDPPAYLVDGVAINGVSGGPVFDNRKHIVGFVSAYIPNRLNQNLVLPGLSSIIPIHIILSFLEARLGMRRISPKEIGSKPL
jgi:hypothetical protein